MKKTSRATPPLSPPRRDLKEYYEVEKEAAQRKKEMQNRQREKEERAELKKRMGKHWEQVSEEDETSWKDKKPKDARKRRRSEEREEEARLEKSEQNWKNGRRQ